MGATPSASQTLATSAAGNGNVPFITGRHCSRPSVLTCSSVLMSMSRSRTFTLASVRGESRYTSSLSCARPGASALKRPSASPKLAPKVRHSQRGMIASIEWLRQGDTCAHNRQLRGVRSAPSGLLFRGMLRSCLLAPGSSPAMAFLSQRRGDERTDGSQLAWRDAMRIGTRRRLELLGRVVGASILVGSAYGALINVAAYGVPRFGILIGAIHGFLLGSTIGSLEIFGTRVRLGRAVEQAPFLVTLLIKALIYGSIIAFVNIVEPGTRLVHVPLGTGPMQLVSIIFSFAVTGAVIFMLQISQIVGGRTLRDWVMGRYHRPRREERFFLFIDIAGSTALAERIGPVAVHRFLNGVFLLASDPVDDYRGEIYQYVGDEMVITWMEREGRLGARPIRCFAAIEAVLEAAAPDFLRDFGVAPRVRGALHFGSVVVGEVGGRKRDIVFHGDAMNTTSRLEHLARELDQRLVISDDAWCRLPIPDDWAFEDLGPHALRGRSRPVQVYAASRITPLREVSIC